MSEFKGKIRLVAINVVVGFVLLELGSCVAYPIRYKEPFSRERIRARMEGRSENAQTVASREVAGWIKNKAVHPYLGFAYDVRGKDGELLGDFAAPDPVFNASDEQVVVTLSGGSVAQSLYSEARETLVRELASIPEFQGREIVIQPFSGGGFKQPQLLLALAYYLVRGYRVDLWINLDGFNEIALPLTENAPDGVALSYPRSWPVFARSVYRSEELDAILDIRESRRRREGYRELFRLPLVRNSAFGLFLWRVVDDRFDAELQALDGQITKLRRQSVLPAFLRGPQRKYSTPREALAECSRIWKTSSFEMAALCKASDISYFHFLQPNQYVQGSKSFTDEELRIAVAGERYPYRRIVEDGYPMLIAGGRELQEMGVAFHDLTGIYRNESGTIYADKCCHVNETGYQIMAREIGGAIARAYAEGR